MIINYNLSATNAGNHLRINDSALNQTIEKLSSGKRINKAADDASGLAVAEKMLSQIRGLKRASSNAQDDISFVQTTEGHIRTTMSILQKIRQLAVQAANGVYTDEDRLHMQVEVDNLISEINRISETAQFNTLNMLTGRYARSEDSSIEQTIMWFHVGANMDQRIQINIEAMDATSLGLKKEGVDENSLTLINTETSNKAIGDIDLAIKKVNSQLADLGAYQNRLEFTIEGLMTTYENMKTAESGIRNADMASESIELFKNQILVQSSTLMLSQANVKPQVVLKLLQI